MNYKEFSKKTQNLIYSNIDVKKKIDEWSILKKNILSIKKHSRHISKLIFVLNSNLKAEILDHGCGSCSTLLYLSCLGYNNIWGVDIDCDNERLNIFLKEICKLDGQRIFNYDGKNLPFKNNKFDLVISQQVLEHVKYHEKENTIEEQSRVMKNGAYAYFQIPHVLVPFEAHTKTWFIHWLPRKFALIALKILNKNYLFYQNHLFLSLPFKYKRIIKKKIGYIEDLSHERVSVFNNEFNELKGFSLTLRLVVAKVCSIPYIGRSIMKLLSNFIMIEVLAKKK